jgi:hypothetical protein
MSLEAFGDDDSEDLIDAVARYGWSLAADGTWAHEDADREPLNDEQMAQWLQDKRDGDQEDFAEWDARG